MNIRNFILSSIIAAGCCVSPALASNHDTGEPDVYCGDMDSIAEPGPECIAWDGDIEAQADTGPWQDTEQFPGMNVIVLGDDEHPTMTPRRARILFGEGETVEIRIIEPAPPRRIGSRSWCSYGGPWWCKNHASAPGQDEDRRGRERDITQIDRPDNFVETPRDPNPWNDPGNPDDDHQPSEREVRDRQQRGMMPGD